MFTFKVSYMIFLGLFTYVLLTDLKEVDYKTGDMAVREWIVFAWVVSLTIDEIAQVNMQVGRHSPIL